MKRYTNTTKQMALDFDNCESEALVMKQKIESEEETNRKIDEAFHKWVYAITILVILSNFIFV